MSGTRIGPLQVQNRFNEFAPADLPYAQANLQVPGLGKQIAVGNAGATQTVTALPAFTTYNMVLNANCVATLASSVPTGFVSRVRIFTMQNSTGGWTLSVVPGSGGSIIGLNNGLVAVNTLPGVISGYDFESPDGLNWTMISLGPDVASLTQATADGRYVRFVGGVGPDGTGNVDPTLVVASSAVLGAVDMGPLKGLTTDPRNQSPSAQAMIAGYLYCVKAAVKSSVSISELLYYMGTAGAGLSNSYMGIYTFATGLATLVAQTADLSGTGSLLTTGAQSAALTSSYTTVSGGSFVIVAVLIGAGTTMPAFNRAPPANTNLTLGQDGTLGYPYFAYGTGLTALPSTFVLSAANCLIGSPGPGVSAVVFGLN